MRVETLRLRGGEPRTIDAPSNPTISKIHTGESLYGIGEIGVAYGVGAHGEAGPPRDFAEVSLGVEPHTPWYRPVIGAAGAS